MNQSEKQILEEIKKIRAKEKHYTLKVLECLEIIDKKMLYRQRRPRKIKNTSLKEVMNTPIVKRKLSFEFENYAQEEGGPTFALSQVTDGGVRLINAFVHGKTPEPHAFERNLW